MAVERIDLIPTMIPNTTMQKIFVNGVHKQYSIRANEGYILHDKNYDSPAFDENGDETGGVILGFRPPESVATCAVAQLVADENGNIIVNPREFYAILESELPEGAEIFGSVMPPIETI